MPIRPATATDADALWAILEPVIRAGETYTLDCDLSREQALAYWCGSDKQTFVFEDADNGVLGTYYLRANQTGGGAHVCNCGYMTASQATGKGVARQMCADSLDRARAQGFRAMQFNFVVSTNSRAVALWQSFGFTEVGRLPLAFEHPTHGLVDALVLHRAL